MRRRTLTWGRVALGIVASIVLGWLAVRGLDWGEVVSHLSGVSPVMTTLSLALFMLASLVRAARWHVLFVSEPRPSIPRLFIIQNVGIGLNNFLPLRIASEAVQFAILTIRDKVKPATALATLGMERAVDVIATMLMFGIAPVLVPDIRAFLLDLVPDVWVFSLNLAPEMRAFLLYLCGVIALTLLVGAFIRLIIWCGQVLALTRHVPFLAAFAAAVRDLERERARLAASFAATLVYWLMVGVAAWATADGIGLPISPVTAMLVIIGTIFFSTVVPAAPSAIGTFEWAVVSLLGFFDVDRSAAFGYAVVIHAVFFLPPTIIAALFLPREGVFSWGGGKKPVAESPQTPQPELRGVQGRDSE